MRTAFFWGITQRIVVIYYRRFGTTYRSHLLRSTITTVDMQVMNYVAFSIRSL